MVVRRHGWWVWGVREEERIEALLYPSGDTACDRPQNSASFAYLINFGTGSSLPAWALRRVLSESVLSPRVFPFSLLGAASMPPPFAAFRARQSRLFLSFARLLAYATKSQMQIPRPSLLLCTPMHMVLLLRVH